MLRKTDLDLLFKKATQKFANISDTTSDIAIPNSYVIKLTTSCNLKCDYCYMGDCSNYSQMDKKLFLRILDQIKSLTSSFAIYLHGGEPCLRVDLIERLRAWLEDNNLQNSVKIMLQTNGSLINNNLIRLIKEMNINVGVSIDGITPESNKARVFPNNSPTVNVVLNTIDQLLENDVKIGIFSVITSYNASHMLELIQYFTERGVRSFVINPLVLWGRASESKESMITQDQMYHMYIKIIEWLISFNSINGDNPALERNLHWWFQGLKGKKGYMCNCSPCGAGTQTISISPEGNVFICDQFYNDNDFFIGNITKKNLHQIINAAQPAIHSFRNVFNISQCKKCEWRYVCCGGCSASSYYYSGNMDSVAPYCEAYKSIFNFLDIKLQDDRIVL